MKTLSPSPVNLPASASEASTKGVFNPKTNDEVLAELRAKLQPRIEAFRDCEYVPNLKLIVR